MIRTIFPAARPVALLVAAWVVSFLAPSAALAQSGDGDGGPLGLGVLVGSPTGVTAKWRATPSTSFDAAVGLGFGNTLHVHADWLFEGDDLVQEEEVSLGWFAGIGGRFSVRDHDNGNGNGNGNDEDDEDDDDDDVDTGPRFPVGLELQFSSVKRLEIFAEIALGLEVADDTGLFLDGGIGARWFF